MPAISRVTQGLMTRRTLNNLNRQLGRIAELQERLASGTRVSRPSEDPIDARRAISLRTLIAKNEQFISNISDVRPQLRESETTMLNVVDIIQRVQELTIQGSNETLGQSQMDLIALEIDQLLEDIVLSANHRTNNRSLFGGTRTLQDAFGVTRVAGDITAVTFQGNTQAIEVDVADGSRQQVNLIGSDIFQSNVDIFQMLIGIRDDLRAGNQANLRNVRLDEIRTGQEQLLFEVSRAGTIQNRMDQLSGDLRDFNIQFQEVLSDKVDADFAETMLDLNVAQNAFTGALNAASRVIQPSLLDFLR